MRFDDVINARYSVRKYSDRKVEDDKIEKIVHSINIAPTAKNTNCVRVYALTNEQVLERLKKEVTPCTFDAPLLFVVCSDENEAWISSDTGNSRGMMDASIAADHLMLTAVSQGLGTCWVCLFDSEKMKQVLGLAENIVPHCIIVCGYAAEDSKPSERHTMRIDRVTYVR